MSLLVQKHDQSNGPDNGQDVNGQDVNGQDVNGHRTAQSFHARHDGKRVSEEEYWTYYYDESYLEEDASYEWNNGVLEAKPMANQRQARLYNWFLEILSHFLKVHPVALMMNLEIGFRMEVDDPKRPGKTRISNRKPDIGVICDDNPVVWLDEDRSYKGVCDMIIESLSDSDKDEIHRDTVTKKNEYQAAGIREYFILDPNEVYQVFYRLADNQQYSEITPDDDVIRSEVLPGFQFRLSDLVRQPTLEEMAVDEVYSGFILPAYQAALQQVAEERIRAEKADARADRLEALLRARGIDPSDLGVDVE